MIKYLMISVKSEIVRTMKLHQSLEKVSRKFLKELLETFKELETMIKPISINKNVQVFKIQHVNLKKFRFF